MKKLNQKFLTVLLGLMMVGQGWAMSGSSSENMAGQGSPFTNAYDYSFTTSGTTVNISFTEHDNYTGLVAYLWNYTSGFAETQMNVSGHTATIALTNQTAGTTLKFACKFAYADGMSVTKQFEYTVEGGDTPTPPAPTTGIDWSKISWVAASNDKFKVGADASLGEQMPNEVVNVQQPGFATKSGIYMTFPGDVSECTHEVGIQGGGLCLYIDQFTAKETKVTVTYAGGSRTFTIYYADGTEPGPVSDLEDPKLTITDPSTAAIELAIDATKLITWTSSNTATPSFTSSNSAAVEVSADGLITAKAIGLATITVEQAATDTYKKATKTITVTVPGDKSKNTQCSGWNDDIWASQGGYTYDFSTTATDVVLKITAIGEFPPEMAASPQILFSRRNGGDGFESGGVVSGKTITWTFSKTSVLTRDDNPYLFSDNTIHFKPYIARRSGVDQTNEIIYTVGEDCSGGGDTPDPEPTGNLFNAASASITTYFAGDETSSATYNNSTGKITTIIGAAKTGQWQAQVKLNTGITSMDATKKVYFTCKMKSNVTVNGATIKMFDDNQIYYDTQIKLPANEEKTVIFSGQNAVATTGGIIVFDFGWAPANTTIEIYDIEIGYGEIEDDSKPSAAPTAPSYPAEQVKAVYSATYSANCGFGEWGGGATCTQDAYGKKYVNGTSGYFGMVDFNHNCSQMEKLHLDVWAATDISFRVVPILKDNSGNNYQEQGVMVNITGQQWNSIDIALDEGNLENYTDWSKTYQIKIDNAANTTFWLNNVYFYTTQEQEPEVITQTTWWDEIKIATINNVDYAVLCSVTRNTDKSLTFHMETSGWITGLVPQININNSYRNLDGYTDVNWKADYTTIPGDGTFETGDVVTCYLYFAYSGGSATLTSFQYTVGAENEKPSIAVTGVTINQSAPKLAINEQLQLTETVTPSLVENKNVTWSSSSPTTVSVSETGMVTALAVGTATIRATSVADNTKYGEVLVTVQAALEDAVFYGNGYITRGEPAHLVAINYTITRTSERKLVYALDFSENVEGMVMQVRDAVAYNNLVLDETKMHATFTSTGTYTDGVKITPEHFIYFGDPRIELGNYVIGSTNEQPNKLIALNEVVANMLTNGETVDALIARSFIADGANYTLCLPFDMTADQCLAAFGEGYKLFLMGAPYMKTTDVMYLPFSEVTAIEAGKPYLFCPAANVVNPTIEGVTINAAAPVAQGNSFATMTGIYSPADVDESNYVLGEENWLYQSDGEEMYGLRCYFTLTPPAAPAGVRARAVFHNTDVVTDLETIDGSQCTMYDGKYVINGQFVIIRNNVRYNGIGQQVK